MNYIFKLKSNLRVDALYKMPYNFALYLTGVKYDFDDIVKLYIPDDVANHAILIKLIEEIYSHWFTDICVVENCVSKTKLVCPDCSRSVCSKKCQKKHSDSKCSKIEQS